jgi:hypothetical protein
MIIYPRGTELSLSASLVFPVTAVVANVDSDSKNDGTNFPLQTQNFVDHGDDISFANIELVLDIYRLTINKDHRFCCPP